MNGWSKLTSCATLGVVVAAAWLSQGCATRPVSFARGPREYVATDYRTVLKRWTRDEVPIAAGAVNDLLLATATYESWDFRWAYTIRYAEDFRLSVAERQQMLEKELAETTVEHHFYVAVHAPQTKWADLTAEPPAWVVRLVDDTGNETEPEAIERIRKPSAVELTYFPYTSPWRTAHRIRFPAMVDGRRTISPEAHWFGLRFSGPTGYQQVVWELEGDTDRGDTARQGG